VFPKTISGLNWSRKRLKEMIRKSRRLLGFCCARLILFFLYCHPIPNYKLERCDRRQREREDEREGRGEEEGRAGMGL
jgi:hypothetical protein